jgi:hypothetical protein
VDPGVERALAEARALGFLGPGPLEAHEASASAFAAALGTMAAGTRALDLGSGGGVPGLLLAAADAAVVWVLLDRQRRRTSFLVRAVAALGWSGRVEVRRESAEEAAHGALRGTFDVVVARSFATPAITAECACGFLRRGGRLLVAEPPDVDERRWSDAGLEVVGLERASPRGSPVAEFIQRDTPPRESPRHWKAMQARPLW